MSKVNQSRKYYAERLANVSLLERAVIVKNSGPGAAGDCLAVPVGGSRRGGYLEFVKRGQAEKALALLLKHTGFPNLHILELPDKYSYVCFVLVWGKPQTRRMTTEELGRYYGYTEEAIKQETAWEKSDSKTIMDNCITLTRDTLSRQVSAQERRCRSRKIATQIKELEKKLKV